MTSRSPEQVLRDYLSARSSPAALWPVSGAAGWRAETAPGGFDAKPETIQFGKLRSIPHRQVHAVTFETLAGQRLRFTCCVHQDSAGEWQFAGCAGGSADGNPHRGYPWVNLGGGGWPKRFYAGGLVLEDGGEVVRVRLRAANGTVLEDIVEDGLVLFLTHDEVHMPIYADLLDPSGQVVSQHKAMD